MLTALRERLANDSGNALIVTIIITMLVGSIVTLSLNTGHLADTSSASDRNHEGSLGIAEAGVHEEIKRIQEQTNTTYVATFAPLDGNNSQGSYHVETTRCPADASDVLRLVHQSWCDAMAVTKGYVVDSTGTIGAQVLKRQRHVRVSLVLPPVFPSGKYTLFSGADVNINNNAEFNTSPDGSADIFANGNITFGSGVKVTGSVTSARGYIDGGASNTQITGNAWSGGTSGSWAMRLTNVGGWAKASVPTPSNLTTCDGKTPSLYTVQLGTVTGGVTTWGALSGATPRPIDHPNTCSAAADTISPPPFNYNRNNYNPAPQEFGNVQQFRNAVTSVSSISGTYVINDPTPLLNVIDLSGWNIGGDLTIITNTPIYTDGITDNSLPAGVNPILTLVSTYTPGGLKPACTVNNPNSDCAIYVKNQLNVNVDGSCRTATLVYANNGPAAIKNTSNNPANPGTMCGTIVSQGLLMDNNQEVNYDSRLVNLIGFGSETYQIGRWEELPVS